MRSIPRYFRFKALQGEHAATLSAAIPTVARAHFFFCMVTVRDT